MFLAKLNNPNQFQRDACQHNTTGIGKALNTQTTRIVSEGLPTSEKQRSKFSNPLVIDALNMPKLLDKVQL